MYYAKEYLDSNNKTKLQSITQQTSKDMGKTWTDMIIACSSGSRERWNAVSHAIY